LTPDNKKTGRQRGFHLRARKGLNLRPLAPELKFAAAACCKALLIALRKAKSDGIVLPSVAVWRFHGRFHGDQRSVLWRPLVLAWLLWGAGRL
jgi:hypothetical protein